MIDLKCGVTFGTKPKDVPSEVSEIHLIRPVDFKVLEQILKKCWQLGKISLNASCLKRLPSKAKKAISQKGIKLEIENRRGRPIGVDFAKIGKIVELAKDEQSFREIERLTGVPKSTCHYLIKYADRSKLKKGNMILYLK